MTRRNLILGITLAALAVGGSAVLAGPGGPGGPGMRGPDGSRHGGFGAGRGGDGPLGPLGRALHRLDLTDEQRAQIRTVVEAARPQLQQLRGQLRDGRQAFREANPPTTFDEAAIRAHVAAQSAVMADLAVLGAKVRADVLALLTPEQLEELERMRAKREQWREMRRDFWSEGS